MQLRQRSPAAASGNVLRRQEDPRLPTLQWPCWISRIQLNCLRLVDGFGNESDGWRGGFEPRDGAAVTDHEGGIVAAFLVEDAVK